jgi:tetratricopeptide (TPR) repeat protein
MAPNDSKTGTATESTSSSLNDSRVDELPIPPENPREQLHASLSACGAILCLLLTTAIIVYLFYYANAEEKAAKESQHKAEFMRDKAETLIAKLTEHLRQQQGKPVDVRFAVGISTDVSDYYEKLNINDSTVRVSPNLGTLLSDVALLCKTQGLLDNAYAKYDESFQIFSKLTSDPHQNEDAWIRGSNCLSGQGDVSLRQGKFVDAEEKYRASLERRSRLRGDRSIPDRETDYAQGLVNMGDLNRELGNLNEALDYVDQGLKVENDAIAKLRSNSQGKSEAPKTSDGYTLRLMIFKRTRADLLRKLGRLDEANKATDEVLQSLKDLSNSAADPDVALTHLVKADILCALGYFEDAATNYNKAYSIWETIVRRDEYNLLTQSLLVDSLLGQGDIFLAQSTPGPNAGSNLEKAAEKYREALKKLSELHADADAYEHQAKIALAETKLGEVALAQGDISAKLNDQTKAQENFTDALTRFLKSEGTYESWSRGSENRFEANSALAVLLCKEGDAYMKLNKFDEGKTAYDHSRQIEEWILERAPKNLERRLELAVSKRSLGEALLKISEQDGDYRLLERARDLCAQCNQIYIDARKSLSSNVLFLEQEARWFHLKGMLEEDSDPSNARGAFENVRGLLVPPQEAKRPDRIGEEILGKIQIQYQEPQTFNN